MYAIKTLVENRLRFVLTVFGIALCTILMLLLFSIYEGVSNGSVEYIRSGNADLWVLQKYSGNILRSNSYLSLKLERAIARIDGVETVAPVFFLLASVDLPGEKPTIYLTGYRPETGMGGPPEIIAGRQVRETDEIVIDQSFAEKYRIKTGDKLPVKKDTLTVAGISSGTNMFVVQYAFVTLEKAFSIAGVNNYVSGFQVKIFPGSDAQTVSDAIEKKLGNTSVYLKGPFLENNIKEMESGILPLLFVVALISAIVLTAVLSLILTIYVMEQREDYAILKALGAGTGYVSGLVVRQAAVLTTSGLLLGIILFFPFVYMVENLSPEVSTKTTVFHVVIIVVAVGILSLVSTVLPNIKLSGIYPLEVFK